MAAVAYRAISNLAENRRAFAGDTGYERKMRCRVEC